MVCLESFDGLKNLTHLIRFSHTVVILDIDSRITWPGRFVDTMAAACLPWRAEIEVTYLAQITKTDALGVASHFCVKSFDPGHGAMIPLLIALSKQKESMGAWGLTTIWRQTRFAARAGRDALGIADASWPADFPQIPS